MAFDSNVPVATNTLAVDLAAINANWEYALLGSPTTVAPITDTQTLRIMQLKVEEGTNANTIKCTPTNLWNASTTPGTTDNIGKTGTAVGNYNLQVTTGKALTILAAGLNDNCRGVLSVSIWGNTSTTQVDPMGLVHQSQMVLALFDSSTGATVDWEETMVEAATEFYLAITYITELEK